MARHSLALRVYSCLKFCSSGPSLSREGRVENRNYFCIYRIHNSCDSGGVHGMWGNFLFFKILITSFPISITINF